MRGQRVSSVGDRYRLGRRQLLAALCVSFGMTVGGTGAVVASGKKAGTIRFGLTPVFLTNDLELLGGLRHYLAKATGHDVELVTRRTYQEVTSLLVTGELDAAWICGYPFVKFRDALDLVAVPDWNGRPYYRSYLIVGSDRAVESIEELGGDIHAYSDPDSNSGYLVTQALLHELDLSPNRFFRDAMFTYGHRNVIRAVASRLAQSGSVDGYVWEVMREIEPELVNRTRILRRSEWLGFPPVAANRRVAQTEKMQSLSQAFLAMSESEEGRDVLRMLRLTGFSLPEDEIYRSIAEKVEALKGVL